MKTYITVQQSPAYHQITLEEFLLKPDARKIVMNPNTSNTRTYVVDEVKPEILEHLNVAVLISHLYHFNEQYGHLLADDMSVHYNTFPIPKFSGGLRWINEPHGELMRALRDLKELFERDYGALYHTAAFAYVKHRCNVDAIKRHQSNQSKWFYKTDLHDFFGSTSKEFVLQQLSMIYPFSEVIKDQYGRVELDKALSLAFLEDGLPQGTPISPMLTNLIMIPIDHRIANDLREYRGHKFIYTRYADDFLISCRQNFCYQAVEEHVLEILKEFNAPYVLNERKTRYASSSGSNWNLGLMLNKDNEITIGHKRKRNFRAMLTNYANDKKRGVAWSMQDVKALDGLRSYYIMVEKENIENMVQSISDKFGVDIMKELRKDLSLT